MDWLAGGTIFSSGHSNICESPIGMKESSVLLMKVKEDHNYFYVAVAKDAPSPMLVVDQGDP